MRFGLCSPEFVPLFEAFTAGGVRGGLGSSHGDPERFSSQVTSVSAQEDSAVISLADAGELFPLPSFAEEQDSSFR